MLLEDIINQKLSFRFMEEEEWSSSIKLDNMIVILKILMKI
jgi:hypothetical protein